MATADRSSGEDQFAEMPNPGDAARRELAVVDRVLAERRQLAITAAGIAPPSYITNALGEGPSEAVSERCCGGSMRGSESSVLGSTRRGRAGSAER